MNNSTSHFFSNSYSQLIVVNRVKQKLKRVVELNQIIDSETTRVTVSLTKSKTQNVYVRKTRTVKLSVEQVAQALVEREMLLRELQIA